MLFKYEQRARQLVDFSTLSWGCIHPSDIDGCLEFDGYKLILFEFKTAGKSVDYGQRLLLERIADNWRKAKDGNTCLVVVADHYTTADEVVDGGTATVRCIYYDGKWYDYQKVSRTVKEVVQKYAEADLLRKVPQ